MLTLPGKSVFSPSKPQMPAPPPPPPKRDDPEIAAAKDKQRMADLKRKGRAASVLTSGRGVEEELGAVARPEARSGAQLLGG